MRCGVGARAPGLGLRIHGHGWVERQLWGPGEAEGRAELSEIRVRRFRCLACGAVIMVGPVGLLRYRRYRAAAIAVALFLWSLAGVPARQVHARVSPWRIRGSSDPERWEALRDWVEAIRARRLWPFASPRLGAAVRDDAVRIVQALVGRVLPAVLGALTAASAFEAGAHSC